MTLSGRILLGLGLGVVVGLGAGEPAAVLQPVADVYVRLMQMTVLPYLVLSLLTGLGGLSPEGARQLLVRGAALLGAVWVLTLSVIGLMSLTFPVHRSASFYSDAMVTPHQPFALAELYVPANPFHSLANDVVPAVVLFTSAVGIALIGVPGRERVIGALRVLTEAMVRVTRFVIALTPIGVFAIAAVAAGTMTLEALAQLQVYLVAFTAASLLLAFWILPLLVAAVTPFGRREVLTASRDAVLTAFVTNSVFIVLPLLVERANELLERRGLRTAASHGVSDVVVPMLFNFPNAGRLLTLLFVPFAAWLAGTPLSGGHYPTLFGVGLVSYFAKAQVAIPFLMDLLGVPQDLFQLYFPTAVWGGKLDSMVSAVNLLAFALVLGAAAAGAVVLETRRLLRAGLAVAIGIAVTVAGTGMLLAATVDTTYRKAELLTGMRRRPVAPGVRVVVHDALPSGRHEGGRGLEGIRARGAVRVGYVPERLPFSFVNDAGELVGFDVEVATLLARDLDVDLELVPVDGDSALAAFEAGSVDVIPNVPYMVVFLRALRFSPPYVDDVLGFAVPDGRRHEFETRAALRRLHHTTIGVPGSVDFLRERLERYLEGVDARLVAVPRVRDFFEGRRPDVDVLFLRAPSAAAWSLLYPDYSVVVPQPDPLHAPAGMATLASDVDLGDFLDEWLVIQRSAGTIQDAYDHWVLGRDAARQRPRWSVVRDVLGWTRPDPGSTGSPGPP